MKFGILFTTASAVIMMMILSGCATSSENAFSPKPGQLSKMEATGTNPFYQESTLYFKYPPFDKIKNAHYAPAFEKGMAEQLAEIEGIADQSDAPTFENTIVAMEKSGQLLNRVATVFYSLASAHTNDSLEAVRSEMAPKLSAHSDQILLNSNLFERIRTLYDQKTSLGLDAEAVRLVEETYKDFTRAGANLSADDKERLKAINAELARQLESLVSNPPQVVVLDMAVLVESDLGRLPNGRGYTQVVVVETDPEVRLARLLERGMSADDARARMASQATDDERRTIADHILTNDGDEATLDHQVDTLWATLAGGV